MIKKQTSKPTTNNQQPTMSYNNLPTDVTGIIMKIRYELMIEDKMIRLEQHQRQLMVKMIDDDEIMEGGMEYWIEWNFANGKCWQGGFNEDELDVDDDDYDNPIWID